MESAVIMKNDSQTSWADETVNSKNIYQFIDYLIDTYPQYGSELVDIKKKVAKKSKSVLSILITFLRNIDKTDSNNDEFVLLIRKFIQVIMDNPKGFKK
jgi:hypothetical protein